MRLEERIAQRAIILELAIFLIAMFAIGYCWNAS